MAANGDHPLLPRHKQTTPTPSRPDRAGTPATGYGWAIGKPSGRRIAKASITSPHYRPSWRELMLSGAGP